MNSISLGGVPTKHAMAPKNKTRSTCSLKLPLQKGNHPISLGQRPIFMGSLRVQALLPGMLATVRLDEVLSNGRNSYVGMFRVLFLVGPFGELPSISFEVVPHEKHLVPHTILLTGE